MMRLIGQDLLIRSSSSPLTSFSRSISFQSPSLLPCYSTKPLVPLVSFRSIRIASQSSNTKLILTSRSRLSGFVRASHQASDAGSIDASMMQSMENKIKEELNADTVIIKDAYGDGRHVSIYVVSSAFEGQSAVNRQRMVYKAIWEELQSTVHAVDQMITNTPSEANKNQ